MRNINFKIDGMHCTACSNRLEKVLNNLDGVESAIVNFENKNANIKFNENFISIEKIKEVIEDIGFKGEEI